MQSHFWGSGNMNEILSGIACLALVGFFMYMAAMSWRMVRYKNRTRGFNIILGVVFTAFALGIFMMEVIPIIPVEYHSVAAIASMILVSSVPVVTGIRKR